MERLAGAITAFTGSTPALALALGTVVVWVLLGPVFHYADTWQLAINTGTTIVTFLMVFVLQRSQNKEAVAFQLKLNEIVAALEGASNRVEDLTEDELAALRGYYKKLAALTKQERDIRESHSIDEDSLRRDPRHTKKRT